MAPVTNGRYILKENLPTDAGYPIPGKTYDYDVSEKIDLETVTLNGGILVKVVVLSVDPYMRGKMAPLGPYYPVAYVPGEPLDNYAVGLVLRTETQGVAVGDHIYGILPFQQYTVLPSLEGFSILKNEENLPWSNYVGVAGMPGKTAWMGWKEFARPKKHDVVFVSTGAGAVGSVVVQLAKLDGLKVIASTGSDDKVEYLQDLGVDIAFNYKTTDVKTVLAKEGPIDIFWDNVGGYTLDVGLDSAAMNARFIECGMTSIYNGGNDSVKNLFQVITKALTMNGLIVGLLHPKYEAEFYSTVPKLVSSGKLTFVEDVTDGLENTGVVILAQQKGLNAGKSVIRVA